jgi:tartrate dehydratase alpha subunit/fumarate hydratase class I-like protein
MAIGKKTGGGSRLGKQNKLTKSVKEAFEIAFNQLQDDSDANLAEWAKNNTTEFYKLAAKLIPTSVSADITTGGKEIRSWTVKSK